MKTILLPLFDDDSADAALETARLLAARFGAFIEGLFVRATPPTAQQGPIPPHFLNQYHEYWDQSADNARRRFTDFMKDHDVQIREVGVSANGPTAWWTELEGERPHIIGSYGRLFDVIVASRSGPQSSVEWAPSCEAALFESGRPVLLSAMDIPKALGKTIVIAWNGSTETARTIALGMPILRDAKKVTVLSVRGAGGGMVPGPDGTQVAAYLSRSGVPATAVDAAAQGRSSGETVLEEAAALGADLLVKGAYTHNRLRQMVFGGTTRQVLNESRIPVLIAH